MSFEDALLDVESWPETVKTSPHFPLLQHAAAFSLDLESCAAPGADDDAELHQLFGGLSRLAPGLPRVRSGRVPAHLRATWDLRALSALLPPGLELELRQESAAGESGDSRWTAALFDPADYGAPHPALVPQNHFLHYGAGEYSEAWTPNLALARILLAAYLLAAIYHLTAGSTAEGQEAAALPPACLPARSAE